MTRSAGAERLGGPAARVGPAAPQLPPRMRAPLRCARVAASAPARWGASPAAPPAAAWAAPTRKAHADAGRGHTCSSRSCLAAVSSCSRGRWRAVAVQALQQEQQRHQQPEEWHDPEQRQQRRGQPQQHQQQQRQQHRGASGQGLAALGAATVVAQLAAWGAHPEAAHAGEALSSSLVEVFQQFLEQIQALGPWGAVLFVTTVALAEMVPLFPTQPLSLASGLLFGAKHGALLMLLGVTLAGLGAFSIARGVGRPLAERIIKAEMGEGEGGGKGGGAGSTWAAVEGAIESGGFLRQVTAVTLLRLTPVVPYSATNYLLGLTPIELPAFLLGTLGGMSVWSVLYASLGGASRSLLEGGADLELLLADLGDKASRYSQDIAVVGVAVLGVGAAAWLLTRQRAPEGGGGGGGGGGGSVASASPPALPPQPPSPRVADLEVEASVARREELLNHK